MGSGLAWAPQVADESGDGRVSSCTGLLQAVKQQATTTATDKEV